MRTIFVPLSLMALATNLQATQLAANESIQTLARWSVSGANNLDPNFQADFTLPAGAQISRIFDLGNLTIQTTTTPTIGIDAKDWPALEIGSSALVLSREANVGKLILILNERQTVELPFTIALDDQGTAAAPIAIVYSFQGTNVVISLDGSQVSYPIKTILGNSVEVSVSAGANIPWNLSQFAVIRESVPSVPAAPSSVSQLGKNGGNQAPVGFSHGSLAQVSQVANASPVNNTPFSDKANSESVVETRAVSLEIFTPPSVRLPAAATVKPSGQFLK